MLEVLLLIVLVILVLILCVILALVGAFAIYSKVFTKEPKNEPPPISDEEKMRLEMAEKRRVKQEQNFWNYDGFKQE